MESNKAPSGARKAKKKQVKDELDRLKQAEKKRKRLEKALATSAAIRSELEKKKNKKKEEQQRLDEEGAAIAEAVALHVLGEDSESDDICRVMLKKDEILNHCASNFDLLMRGKKAGSPYHDISKYSLEKIERVSDANRSGCMSYNWEDIDWTISSRAFGRKITMQCSDDGDWEEREISAGIIAARALSSLRIAEDARVNTRVFTQMLRG